MRAGGIGASESDGGRNCGGFGRFCGGPILFLCVAGQMAGETSEPVYLWAGLDVDGSQGWPSRNGIHGSVSLSSRVANCDSHGLRISGLFCCKIQHVERTEWIRLGDDIVSSCNLVGP